MRSIWYLLSKLYLVEFNTKLSAFSPGPWLSTASHQGYPRRIDIMVAWICTIDTRNRILGDILGANSIWLLVSVTNARQCVFSDTSG